jgi:hypothetical protein
MSFDSYPKNDPGIWQKMTASWLKWQSAFSCQAGFRVLHLCSVNSRAEAQSEKRAILNRENEIPETQKSVFPV